MCRQIKWEVVSITLMHNFETKIGTIKNVSPSIYYLTLTINKRLIEVKTIQVECHGAYSKRSKPNTNHRPSSEEEVKTTAVIKGSVLEDEPTKIAVVFTSSSLLGLWLVLIQLQKIDRRRLNQEHKKLLS